MATSVQFSYRRQLTNALSPSVHLEIQSTQVRNIVSDLNALYNEAEALKDEGKTDEAIEKLNELLGQDEKHALAHFALAVLYGRVNNHDKAVEHGETATDIEPTDPFSFTALSVTYQRAYAGTGNMDFITKAETARDKAHALQAQAAAGNCGSGGCGSC